MPALRGFPAGPSDNAAPPEQQLLIGHAAMPNQATRFIAAFAARNFGQETSILCGAMWPAWVPLYRLSRSGFALQSQPDLSAGQRHIEVSYIEFRQRIHDGVDHRWR